MLNSVFCERATVFVCINIKNHIYKYSQTLVSLHGCGMERCQHPVGLLRTIVVLQCGSVCLCVNLRLGAF